MINAIIDEVNDGNTKQGFILLLQSSIKDKSTFNVHNLKPCIMSLMQ
jgi:hypothetical protein